MGNSYQDRWEVLDEIGSGGQGIVYLVRDLNKIGDAKAFDEEIRNAVMGISLGLKSEKAVEVRRFREIVNKIVDAESPRHRAALKVLHGEGKARDALRAEPRIRREIEAMQSLDHPGLLKLLDANAEDCWFVAEYHQNGTIEQNRGRTAGNLAASLDLIRPLVVGVSKIHDSGMIHRDIKPNNVFVADDGRLVLGDFGLVFYEDPDRTRISETYENVGSRDWMPPWAFGRRIDELSPAFDVFALGKLLWAMLSGKQLLNLWYFDEPKFDVESLFPSDPAMRHANSIFKKCIVEHEEQCLPDATALLERIDNVRGIIKHSGEVLNDKVKRICRVCGIGFYQIIGDPRDKNSLVNIGMSPVSGKTFKVLSCIHCGHLQTFVFNQSFDPPAWRTE